ncbi:MAG: leucine-rich repeat protein, partial [Verrucomicrobia bacterium]|nr:leucine-rich repeat protein [Verrucomicrobiota bacterium]
IGDGAFEFCGLIRATIGNSATSIGDYAFEYCPLTSVAIPDGVTNIGQWAFGGCAGLTKVTIGAEVTSIGDWAFADCNNLAGVTIPNNVTSIGNEAFYYCYSLTNVSVGTSVNRIGSGAFFHCSRVTSVTIPDSVISIGDSAFEYCGLTRVTIGNRLTAIGDGAFGGCAALEGIYFQGNAPSGDSTSFSSDPGTVYYLPGTLGWGATYGGLPTAQWTLPYPLILNNGPNFGVQAGGFGFIISWATNISVVVEASTNLADPIWTLVATNTLIGGSSYFNDPQWVNYSSRFYRISSP